MNVSKKMRLWLALVGFGALVIAGNASAEPAANPKTTFQIVLKPQSRLWLNGNSTLHPYASTATVINLQASFQSPNAGTPAALAEKVSQANVTEFKVTIPVESLKSGEKGLDKNMYKALNAEKFPSIEFRLTDNRLLSTVPTAGANKLASNGVLTIAGKENTIQMDSQVEVRPDGIHIVGEKKLLMTDYGVKPPTILGFIKVTNDVTVHYDLLLAQQESQR